MDSFEFNKIAAAVLVVALLVIGLNQIADSIYRVKKPETQGYKIEGVAETKSTAKGEVKKEEKLADIKVLLATANVGAGENVQLVTPMLVGVHQKLVLQCGVLLVKNLVHIQSLNTHPHSPLMARLGQLKS
jgi:hypothetical protein